MAEQKYEYLSNLVELRDVLQEPYQDLIHKFELVDYNSNKNFLFQAFCGIGKSRVMYKTIFDTHIISFLNVPRFYQTTYLFSQNLLLFHSIMT